MQEMLEELLLTEKQKELIVKYMKELLLTEEEIQLIMRYLVGKEGDEILAVLPAQDLSKSSIQKIGTELFRVLPVEIAEKIFQVLYAIGRNSCTVMFSFEELMRLKKEKGIYIRANQIAVFAAENIVKKYSSGLNFSYGKLYGRWNVREWIESIIQMIGRDTNVIVKALEEYRGVSIGQVFLWTIYFLLKYPDMELGKEVVLSESDQLYKTQYEDSMLACLKEELKQYMPKEKWIRKIIEEKWDRIVEGFRKPNFSKEFIKIVEKVEMRNSSFKWVSVFAFINSALSDCCRNIVAFWIEKKQHRWEVDLGLLENLDFRKDLELRGALLVQWFGLDPKRYIVLAAESVVDSYVEENLIKGWRNTLSVLFQEYKHLFSQYCEEFFAKNLGDTIWKKKLIWKEILLFHEIMKEQDKEFFEQYLQKVQLIQKERMIFWAVAEQEEKEEKEALQRYFKEEIELEKLFSMRNQLKFYRMSEFVIEDLLEEYNRLYRDKVFCHRYLVYVVLCQGYRELRFFWGNMEERVIEMFRILELERVDFAFQVEVMLQWREYQDKEEQQNFESAAKPVFLKHLKEKREETIAAFLKAEIYGRYFLLLLLEEQKDWERNKELLLEFAKDMAGQVRNKLVDILSQRIEWEKEVRELLLSKRVTEREVAVRVLEAWGKERYRKELELALEKEKNKKLKALLEEMLYLEELDLEEGEQEISKENLLKNMVRQLHKKDKKNSLQWAYQTPFPAVQRKDGELASEQYLQAILLAYSFMEKKEAATLIEELEEDSFAVYVHEVFDRWLQSGAEAKRKWVLFIMAIYGKTGVVDKYSDLIQEWIKQGRGAIASEAVKALALHPASQALLLVDNIARKVKHKQVKAAAFEALELAASQRGITKEELADQIVPDLGFQPDGKRIFDYGERKFIAFISTTFELEVFDENRKKLKNLPAPGKKDNAEKAVSAYEEWKSLKKQIKTLVSNQKLRLEQVFLSGRRWKISDWKKLFVQNAIMVPFAMELVWGIYQDGKLVQSFRYLGDGTFTTEKEDQFVIPEMGKIGLVYPIELSEEEKEAWMEQMEDYEIVQPIEQLNRVIFELSEEEKNLNSLERFGGFCMGDMQLSRKILSLGWERGAIWDAGMIFNYYREDLEIGWGVELYFSGGYVGWDSGEDVVLYDARFYRIGEELKERNGFRIEVGKGVPLIEVPQQYFSEIVRQLSLITVSCEEREENWREKRSY